MNLYFKEVTPNFKIEIHEGVNCQYCVGYLMKYSSSWCFFQNRNKDEVFDSKKMEAITNKIKELNQRDQL